MIPVLSEAPSASIREAIFPAHRSIPSVSRSTAVSHRESSSRMSLGRAGVESTRPKRRLTFGLAMIVTGRT